MFKRIANGLLIGLVLVWGAPWGAQGAEDPVGEVLKEGAAPSHAHGAEDEHADAAGHGDDFDNSHKNATPNLERPEEVRFDLAMYTFVVFALLMALLWKFAWGPISRGLDAREASIAKMIEDARAASETAAKQLAQYEARLAAAQEEAGRIIGDARRQGEEVAARIRSEAESAADKQRQQAVAEIESAKNVALREIAAKSVSTAVDLAGKILRREVREADHQQLIRESLDRFA